jgi:hypothetical protein
MGKTIAQWGPESPQPVADIGLDYEFVHLDYNDNKLRNLRAQFGGEVRICEYEDERICLVTSLDPSLSAADMLAQGGIVPLRNYLSNIRGACENSQAANRVYAAGMAGEKR